MTVDHLRFALDRNEAPVGLLVGAGQNRAAEVGRLLSYLQHQDPELTESELDAMVEELGGHRRTVTSLDHLGRRLVNRLRRKPNPPVQEIFELPATLFASPPRRVGVPTDVPE